MTPRPWVPLDVEARFEADNDLVAFRDEHAVWWWSPDTDCDRVWAQGAYLPEQRPALWREKLQRVLAGHESVISAHWLFAPSDGPVSA